MKSSLFLASLFVIATHGAAILGLQSAKVVPDSFIVVLNPSVSEEALASHMRWADGVLKSKRSATKKTVYSFKGFKGYHLQASKDVAALLADSDDASTILSY